MTPQPDESPDNPLSDRLGDPRDYTQRMFGLSSDEATDLVSRARVRLRSRLLLLLRQRNWDLGKYGACVNQAAFHARIILIGHLYDLLCNAVLEVRVDEVLSPLWAIQGPEILKFLQSIGCQTADAEDIRSDVFLKARHDLTENNAILWDDPLAWLKRTAFRTYLDFVRGRKRRSAREQKWGTQKAARATQSRLNMTVFWDLVETKLCSESQQVVKYLHAGYDRKTIAAALGVSIRTIDRFKDEIKDILGPDLGEEG